VKKTKLFLAVFALVFVYTAIGLAAGAGSTQDETTVTCIVSGKEIAKSEAKGRTEYNGKTYYFCCENCEKSFLENPEKYVNAKPGELHSHEEGEAACSCSSEDEADSEKVKDPVCGMEIEKSKAAATAEYKGKTYYFCMTGCKDKFLKDPAKYIKDGDEKVTCPVMNREIARKDAAGPYEYNGKTFYFCCEDCKAKFIKNPEKYVQ
jgi:Cu+-exporting ATPase